MEKLTVRQKLYENRPTRAMFATTLDRLTSEPSQICKHSEVKTGPNLVSAFRPVFVRHPVREAHYSGLTRQVGQRVFHGWGKGSCSPFSTGGGGQTK